MRRLLLGILIIGIGFLTYKLVNEKEAFTFDEPTSVVYTENAPKTIGPYSQGILKNNTLYISGQIALSRGDNAFLINKDIEQETRQVMFNIGEILKKADMNYNHIVKTTIYVTDLANFKQVNDIYGEFFRSNPPARETVQVDSLPRGAKVEISAIAVKN
jgi:2-iminobutanoate/2-iminopropanoate deaminase